MFRTSKQTKIVIIAILFVLAGAAGVLSIHFYRQIQNLEAYRQFIVTHARQALGRDVRYASGRLSFPFGPALTFEQVGISEKNGLDPFAEAAEISLRVALWPYLLEKKLIIREVIIRQPRALISRDKDGRWNIADLLVAKKDPPPEIGAITLEEGEITLADYGKEKPLLFKDIHFHLERWGRGVTTGVDLDATLAGGGREGRLSLKGKLHVAKESEAFSKSAIEAKANILNLDLSVPWPWFRAQTPFEHLAGYLNTELTIKGQGTDFTAAGSLDIEEAKLVYPAVFPKELVVAKLRLSGEVKKTADEINLSRAEAVFDDLKLRGSFAMKNLPHPDPLVEATVAATAFDLERHAGFIPYGIIPAATADFIRQYIRAGIFHVEAGSLKGRISALKKWGAENRESVLQVRTKVERGVLAFGDKTPPFTGVAGQILVTERAFSFQSMSGNFGASPFTLTGQIENYALPPPATYPFTAAIQPATGELDWLFGTDAMKKLSFAGKTNITLAGKGPAAAYELNGNWNLAAAAYRYGDWLVKPAGQANALGFAMKIGSRGMQMESYRLTLPPLVVSGAAYFPFQSDAGQTSLTARTNVAPLQELRKASPLLAKHEASGGLQATILFAGAGKQGADDLWRGDFSLQNATFRPAAKSRFVNELNGVLHWEGNRLTSSRLTGTYGRTPFIVGGSITGFDQPSCVATFAVPAIAAEENPAREFLSPAAIGDVKGRMTYAKDILHFSDLSFRLYEGTCTAVGETKLPGGSLPSHHYRFKFNKLPVEKLFRETDKEKLITGILSGQGELTAKGGKGEEIKKSAVGTLKLRIDHGTLKKFQVLSRIFSLLNVSQLLRFKLPDMTTEGMAFDAIAAELAINNGVVGTKNLQLDSDSMNMVGMGKVDLVKRTIDATVGIQPLQGVDKIVSKIPVAGWILTDDDRRFITVYFSAKGPLDNPSVQAVPIKGLSEEALDIFKRVFKLPKKLLTDTGEVIY